MVTGLTKVWAGVNDTVTELATTGASLPSGLIAIWKGSTNTIPDGWVLCDGQNGTPDLRDKFVLGAGNSYGVGSTGGEKTHILTVSELPSHNHTKGVIKGLSMMGINDYTSTSDRIYERGEFVHSANNGARKYYSTYNYNYLFASTGDNSEHNNMPPYYALCYIMKI